MRRILARCAISMSHSMVIGIPSQGLYDGHAREGIAQSGERVGHRAEHSCPVVRSRAKLLDGLQPLRDEGLYEFQAQLCKDCGLAGFSEVVGAIDAAMPLIV